MKKIITIIVLFVSVYANAIGVIDLNYRIMELEHNIKHWDWHVRVFGDSIESVPVFCDQTVATYTVERGFGLSRRSETVRVKRSELSHYKKVDFSKEYKKSVQKLKELKTARMVQYNIDKKYYICRYNNIISEINYHKEHLEKYKSHKYLALEEERIISVLEQIADNYKNNIYELDIEYFKIQHDPIEMKIIKKF